MTKQTMAGTTNEMTTGTTTSALLPTMTVNEIVAAAPGTVAVFDAWGVDACCGGAIPLETVAVRHGFDLERLLAELRAAA